MTKTVLHNPVMTKARKRFGQVYPSQPTTHNADIKVGESIRIHGEYCNRSYDQTFNLGDTAEYDSYNLHYTGEITSIGTKTVTITSHGQNHQLSLEAFCWRNYNFDAQRIADENADTMMYI